MAEPDTSSVPSLFSPFARTVHGPMTRPSILTELESVLFVKVLPLGPVPVIVYLVTSISELSAGTSVRLVLSASVERISFIVVVPGFSEHDARTAVRTTRISAAVVFMILSMFSSIHRPYTCKPPELFEFFRWKIRFFVLFSPSLTYHL